MHDEQMTEEKKKIIHLLLSHMTGRFYPLACQSFAVPDMTVDRAVTAMARKKNLPWADNKKVRNSVIRKYVHFRLELASLMVKSDSRCSDFLAETVKDSLDFDITRSFSGEFDNVRRALLPFKSPFAMESGMVIPLITYLSAETGVSLSPLTDYLMKETEEYMARVKEESASFMDALSFCNPDFHDTTALKLPFLLLQCICENLGMEEGGAGDGKRANPHAPVRGDALHGKEETNACGGPFLLPLHCFPGHGAFLLRVLYVSGQKAPGLHL